MRAVLTIALVLTLGTTAADARRRGHHHHNRHDPYVDVMPQDGPGLPDRRGSSYGGAPPLGAPRAAPDPLGGLAPASWALAPPDPNWNGKRFVSPDRAAWFATYATPVGQEPVATHMRTVAFVDGEEITYLRGERDFIAVSGRKGDRIFYRKAVLACGGSTWRHIAFEYPADAKRRMDAFVSRAAEAVDRLAQDGCGAEATSSR